jgi:hypothetical protein
MSKVELGDVLTFGDDPQRWKVTTLHSDGQSHKINAWGIVPIDDNGEEITLQESAYRYDVRTGRT